MEFYVYRIIFNDIIFEVKSQIPIFPLTYYERIDIILYMKIIDKNISIDELNKTAKEMFGNMVKAVVDVEKKIMVIGGELHSDEEALLLERDSKQQNLWGINIYPEINNESWIEFDSMTNLRPSQENRSRGVDSSEIRKQILEIVNTLVKK